MTVREHLQDKVNAWIAKTLWAEISTEKDHKTMRTHELTGDMHQVIPWMMNRMEELLKEFIPEKARAKKPPVKRDEKEEANEEKAED